MPKQKDAAQANKALNIRDMDPDVVRQVKASAAMDGVRLGLWVTEACRMRLETDSKVPA